ncbi:universal stress protein [Hymenobacter puniceus]|uniref:universal stress protein n=1 Tax=Hymenobacter sp. BT190 TaxID=2763505 RepID=UPI0016514C2E|nr:universal stress protein [Hymenobacter sp. BT190]MBC6700381.1 universal stress protein [Hymenobacter sp. BT190]
MTIATILCPIDFSDATAPLVAYAAALAAGTGAELRLLHVSERQPVVSNLPDLAITQQLAHYQMLAAAAGAQVSTSVLHTADVAQAIVAEARQHPADLIVIGAHGRTGLNRFLMGSTAETVVRTAACVTLLVKSPAATPYRASA